MKAVFGVYIYKCNVWKRLSLHVPYPPHRHWRSPPVHPCSQAGSARRWQRSRGEQWAWTCPLRPPAESCRSCEWRPRTARHSCPAARRCSSSGSPAPLGPYLTFHCGQSVRAFTAGREGASFYISCSVQLNSVQFSDIWPISLGRPHHSFFFPFFGGGVGASVGGGGGGE